MDIGTVIAGLNALGSLFNEPIPMTPAQMEEKPKKVQQPMNTFVILPNQTPPMGVGVPPAPPAPPPLASPALPSLLPPALLSLVSPYDVSPTTLLRDLMLSMPTRKRSVPKFTRDIEHNAVDMPMMKVPPNMFFPTFRPDPSLIELYNLFYGTR